MRRSNYHSTPHESPRDLRLWAIVDSLVTDKAEKAAYVAFAQELMVAERSSSLVHRRSSSVPDFSMRTKRVVMKWFERGLSGHLMWLIGEAALSRARVTRSA